MAGKLVKVYVETGKFHDAQGNFNLELPKAGVKAEGTKGADTVRDHANFTVPNATIDRIIKILGVPVVVDKAGKSPLEIEKAEHALKARYANDYIQIALDNAMAADTAPAPKTLKK
jgi:hypothetical protein